MARAFPFKDEILAAYNGDLEPQYDYTDNKLSLLNGIAQQGTPQNAAIMNSLFFFENLIGMTGTKYITNGLGTAAIMETITDSATNTLIASCVSTKNSPTQWTIVEKLFADNGTTVLQQRTIIYTKSGSEWGAVIT